MLGQAQSSSTDGELVIGAPQGDARLTFGRIEDLAVDEAGNVLVLDPLFHNVRMFDRHGRFMDIVGSRGKGPEEFRRPVALAVDSQNALVHVLDPGNARVVTYRRSGTALEYSGQMLISFGAKDICARDGVITLAGYRGGAVVHQHRLDGSRIRSFGRVEPYGNRPLFERLASGYRLLCNAGGVVLAVRLLPYIQFYGREGGLARVVQIPDFQQAPIEVRRTGVTYRLPDDGRYDAIETVIPLTQGRVLIQVARLARGSRVSSLRSLIVDPATGVVEEPDSLRSMARFDAHHPDGYLVVREMPWPAVLLVARQSRAHQ